MKKLNTLMWIGISLFTIILVGAIGGYLYYHPLGQMAIDTTCSSTGDALISKIERTPGASTFKIYFTANQAGDCLRIAWDKDDINTYMKSASPDEVVDGEINANIILNSMTQKFYTQMNTGSSVKLYVRSDPKFLIYGCTADTCRNSLGVPNTEFAVKAGLYCYCIKSYDYGFSGQFSGTVERTGTATLKVTGFSDTPFSFGANNGGSINGANGKINVAWLGSLVGTKSQETPNNGVFNEGGIYKMVQISGTSSSELSSTSLTFSCQGKNGLTLAKCLDPNFGIISSASNIDSCISCYESTVNSRLTDLTSQWVASTRGVVQKAYFDGSNLVAETTPYATEYPQFTMLVDAQWIGVRYILGIPKITCPSNLELFSGNTNNFNFNIENIAQNEYGNFGISFTCNGGSYGLTNNRVTLSPGGSQTIQGYFTKTSSTQTSDTCTLEATTVRPSDKKSVCTFSALTKPVPVCPVPLDKKCSDDKTKLLTCKQDQTGYEEYSCPNGCEYAEGSARCIGSICSKSGKSCSSNANCCEGLSCEKGICIGAGECKNETESCGLLQAKCCEGLKCDSSILGKCVLDLGKCDSCWSWAGSIFKAREEKCEATSIIGETKWYDYINPFTAYRGIANATGLTDQNVLCPIYLIFIGFLLLIGILIILMLLLGITGVVLLFKKLFSKGGKK